MERLGVYKQWRHKRLVKELEQRIYVDSAEPFQKKIIDDIYDFLSGGKMSGLPSVSFDLSGLYHLRHAAHKSLTEGKPDLNQLSLGVMYWLRSQQFYQSVQDRYFTERQRSSIGFSDASKALAMLLSMNWKKQAIIFGTDTIKAIGTGYYSDIALDFKNCANWFFVKLFADWQDIETGFEPERYPAPLFDQLLQCWREPDENQLVELLLAICDQHTHECFERSSCISKQKDFALDPFFGWPIEIHMLFRLREDIGLENPELDHPLMQTGLAPYLPEVPVVTDDLLNRVTEKACKEYPELRHKIVL